MKDLRKKALSRAVTCCVLAMVSSVGFAAKEGTTTLDTIEVNAKHVKDVDKTLIKSSQNTFNLVNNERDLTRNLVGVEIAEGGRTGFNGFSMRGVDSDRVSITVDGIPTTESFMPPFYEYKGYVNGTRNGIELENMSTIDIHKGSNSILAGSGALGGSVELHTKTVEDFVAPDKHVGFYGKFGYASQNEERKAVAGMGWRWRGIEGLVQITHRHHHEMKNFDMLRGDPQEDIYKRGRGLPDPMNYESLAVMSKLGYRFNDAHYVDVFYDDYKQKRFVEEKSFFLENKRFTKDTNPSHRYGLEYKYTPEKGSMESLTARYIAQTGKQIADAYQYFAYPGYESVIEGTKRATFEQKSHMFFIDAHLRPIAIAKSVNTIRWGAGYRDQRFDNDNYETEWGSPKYSVKHYLMVEPVKSQSVFAYAKDTIGLGEKWISELGTRLEHVSYKRLTSDLPLHTAKGTTLVQNPKKSYTMPAVDFSLAYLFTPKTFLQYRLSSGYRFPRVEEAFFELTTSDRYVPNPNLNPERSLTHQITFSHQNKHLVFDTTVYHTDYKDFIDIVPRPGSEGSLRYDWNTDTDVMRYRAQTSFMYSNIPHARVNGIEMHSKVLGSLVGLPKGWYLDTKMAYMKGKRSDGASLLALQPFQLKLGFGYQNEKWHVELGARYVAKKTS